jgi:hypothetical protein
MNDNEKYWTDEANTLLKGRRIVGVRYLTATEVEDYAWDSRGLVLFLDNGTELVVSADDEGNGPGAIFTNNEKTPVLPVLW